MEVKSFPNGIYGAITYLVYDKVTHEALLIDCTSSIDEIKKTIKENKLNLKYILITHGHFDHVYCVSELKKDKDYSCVPVLIHKDDKTLLNQVPTQCSLSGVEEINVPCIDGLIDENTKNLTIADKPIEIIHTKGHSKGGISYHIDNMLFCGDTLFKESIGRTDLFGGSYKELEYSIKEKLYKLNDDTIVYPGHGDSTTIGYEKNNNSYIRI